METRIELKQGWKILQDVHDTGEKIGLYAAREADTSVGSQVSEWEELEELKHLQANPYTLRVTADSISYTLAFKEAFWGSVSRATPAQPPSASWAITRKLWASSGSTILQSASGGRPDRRRAFMRAPGAVCVYQAAGTTRQRGRPPRLTKPPDA